MFKRHNAYPPLDNIRKRIRRIIFRGTISVLMLVGMSVTYYIVFSMLFDTPKEYRLRTSTNMLKSEYKAVEERFEELDEVLGNVVERDRNVFNILFDSDPYEPEGTTVSQWTVAEQLMHLSNKEMYGIYMDGKEELMDRLSRSRKLYANLLESLKTTGEKLDYIPAIQPVINQDLTLLTASFGMRIHPFYKSLSLHKGVDYTVPEGSRVFVTADGLVKAASKNSSSSGLAVIIDHGNDYETHYNHLSRINVEKGQKVRRGDIIALTGNTGLSLVPHLHYEIRYKGEAVDPVNYFFMELTPAEYQRITEIAMSGMQSFD